MANPSLAKLRKLQEQAQSFLHEHQLPLPDDTQMSRGKRLLIFSARVYHSFAETDAPPGRLPLPIPICSPLFPSSPSP
ncbi:MAG: hypothetical protein U1G07_14280 [Verrucomicrobiota bacterium]